MMRRKNEELPHGVTLDPTLPVVTEPTISVVVTHHDGAPGVGPLFEGLSDHTNYTSFEVVSVRADPSGHAGAARRWPGRGRDVEVEPSASRTEALNAGVRAAEGALVLLAVDGLAPTSGDWLEFMVEALGDGIAAVGARLVDPTTGRRTAFRPAPLGATRHLGIAFTRSEHGIRGVMMRAPDPAIWHRAARPVPAVSGCCLLARRADLLANPIDETYRVHAWDWDLCLRLRNLGTIVTDRRATLVVHPPIDGTDGSATTPDDRADDVRRFSATWGPELQRHLRAEATAARSDDFYRAAGPPIVRILSGDEPVARRLREQASREGWHVESDGDAPSDLTIATAVPHDVQRFAAADVAIAVVTDDEVEWARSGALDAATSVVVPDGLLRSRVAIPWGAGIATVDPGVSRDDPDLFSRVVGHLTPRSDVRRIGVATSARSWDQAPYWGDTYLARGLMRGFRRLGHEATELIKAEWRSARASTCDVVIHLRGLAQRPVARGQVNALWIISHPERVGPGECDDYDLVLSASAEHARRLSDELGREVHFMPQATDVDTFQLGRRDARFEAPVMYVGNARWPNRRAPRWLANQRIPFDLHGRNWDHYPEGRLVTSEFIANRDLATAYRSATVVVADHHGSMRAGGFIANRLFDVLAAGGVVLSDEVSGLETIFGDVVPTYSDEHSLASNVDRLLRDSDLRRQISNAGRRIVLGAHTLDHRAARFLELIDAM